MTENRRTIWISSAAAFEVLLCVLILIHIQKQPTQRTKEFFGLVGGEAHLSRGEYRYQISTADWQRLLKEEKELPFRDREADGKLQMIMEQYIP